MSRLIDHAQDLKLLLHAAEKYALRRGCASCRIEAACSRLEAALRAQEVDALRRRLMGGAA